MNRQTAVAPPTRVRSRLTVLLAVLSLAAIGLAQVDERMYSGLVWRNIGPFRGGRVAAVSGVIGEPGTFYMGMPLGGVWKTTSAGTTWYPIMDSVKEASSVGSIAVAPSDPNVIYVGMGDMITGGGINQGNGVYKSTDAGRTWVHLGLDETCHVPSIFVDPQDPNLVMVAAQGNARKESDARGLYRSADGGKTWTKTLYVDERIGVQKIAWAHDKPSVMLATTMALYTPPSGGGPRAPGGRRESAPGTALYKSTDEGVTWKKLSGGGLPPMSGRTCVAIADNTNAQRMFMVQNAGLWRSDDGGDTWRQMDAADRRVANGQGGYNCGVYVNTKNPDIVYVINTCSYVSRDGGETFTGFKGAPGGDDPQQMWLDPSDGNRLFIGSDQGATISLDGGQNWTSWYNQPTAQVYHISVDNQFPYWVYATQQDSGSIMTSSRGNLGEITPLDWSPHPGYEFGSIVADPLNPKISYAGGPGGGIIKVTNPVGDWINVSPNMDFGARLRRVGNQPIAFNPANPHELLAGFQFLMSTTDGGMHWKKLGPDLGYPKGVTPPAEGTATPSRRGGTIEGEGDLSEEEFEMKEQSGELESDSQGGNPSGGAIESFSCSTVHPGTIWVGTNNGLIKVTHDHGTTWDDVTIPNLPNPTRADISAIDASHQDAETAYVAIDYHTTADYAPFVFRTHDGGKTWTKIVSGLPSDQPSGSFARVIRADTKKAGLLFLGTESSMYVSFDDGDHWQSLMLNLPNTSYRDMVVHDNDLVVGTYGRSFWVLDDISPLRQISESVAAEPAHLFKPGDAYRLRRNVNGDTPFPPEIPHALNAPDGALIYYWLGSPPSGTISLTIADSSGKVLRHMSSAPIEKVDEPPAPVPDFWLLTPEPMPTAVGTNRINWDLRCDSPPAFSHSYEINANPHLTPPSPEGPLVLPGEYTVTLSVDGRRYTQNVTVKGDPRSTVKLSDLRAQCQLQMSLYAAEQSAYEGYQQVAAMRKAVADLIKSNPAEAVKSAASDFDTKLSEVGGNATAARRFGGFGGGGSASPTFVAVTGLCIRQLNTLDSGDMAPSETMKRVAQTAFSDLKKVQAVWKAINVKDLAALNDVLGKNGLKPIEAAKVGN